MTATNTNATVATHISDVFGLNVPKSKKLMVQVFSDDTHPQIPAVDTNYVFRADFIREVNAYLSQPNNDALFITGPKGSGKTSGVTQMAARLNWPVQEVTCHARMETADLVGFHTLMSKAPGEAPEMTFQHGPLAVAMRDGHILLLNEVDFLDPGELSGLNDVLEGRPLVIPQNGGEVIKPHANFRVIATGNSVGNGDPGGYDGIVAQNDAAMDRYRVTEVTYPEPAVEKQIIMAKSPKLAEPLVEAMVKIANDIRYVNETGETTQLNLSMSTRVLDRWAHLTMRFKSAKNEKGESCALSYALDNALLRRANSAMERAAVHQICRSVLGDDWHDQDKDMASA